MAQQLSKQKISLFRSLRQKKKRIEEGLFIVEGEKSVLDTADGFIPVAFAALPTWIDTHKGLLPEDCLFEVSLKDMEKISSLSTPPQIVAVYRFPQSLEIEVHDKEELVVMLDGIQDPGNLGTIIRLCDWFGVKRIYASIGTADCYSAKCVQSTMGSLCRVDIVYLKLQDVIRKNPEAAVIGLMLDGENIYKASLPRGGFIVMGNEGNGLSPEMRELLTERLLIPSYPPNQPTAESLNVACATAITLAEFRRKLY